VDKFKRFYELQKFLDSAPNAVWQAWEYGWSEIKHFPKGYDSMDSCGCCITEHAPGWYGKSPNGRRRIICGLNGEKLESSVCGGNGICLDH